MSSLNLGNLQNFNDIIDAIKNVQNDVDNLKETVSNVDDLIKETEKTLPLIQKIAIVYGIVMFLMLLFVVLQVSCIR